VHEWGRVSSGPCYGSIARSKAKPLISGTPHRRPEVTACTDWMSLDYHLLEVNQILGQFRTGGPTFATRPTKQIEANMQACPIGKCNAQFTLFNHKYNCK
jgi:hypothetical protein